MTLWEAAEAVLADFGDEYADPAREPTSIIALRSALAQPPPPDYVLGQERMRERAAGVIRRAVTNLRAEPCTIIDSIAAAALGELETRIRSLPLEAASEGVRSCLWHADCAAADRALRDGVSPSHPPWPAPAAQTTPEPNRAPDGGCTCHFCAAPPRDASLKESPRG